jgi:AcrR family transcriptional regulator
MDPSPPRSRRDERKQETRRELIDSATKVFAERGFRDASLAQIARAAGYTTGAIYFHFGGKDELFLAAFESYALTRVGEVTEIFEGAAGGLPQRARAVADHWMARQAEDPTFMVVALEFFVWSLRKPRVREALAARQAAVRLAIGRLVEQELRTSGSELPMPPQETATVLRELGVGMALAKQLDPEVFEDRLYGDFVELFYRLALGHAREAGSDPARDGLQTRS